MKPLFVAGAVVFVLAFAGAADDAKKELDSLQGTWKIASLEAQGQKLEPEVFKDFKLVVTGDKFVFHAGEDKLEGTFKVDASKRPKTLDVDGKDSQGNSMKSVGIYEIDKDTWKICYVVNSDARPKEFKTGADSEAFLVVYQREKK